MKNVLITVLSIIVIGLSALLVYDKFIKTDDKKENNTVENNALISKIDNTKDWVYNADYNLPTNKESYYGFSDHSKLIRAKDLVVPYININSIDAKNANQEIYNLYAELIKKFNDNLKDEIWYTTVKYQTYLSNNIVSIVIATETAGTDVPLYEYYTYNFNLEGGKLLSYNDIYQKLGYSADSINVVARGAITSSLRELYNQSDFDDYNSQSINNYTNSVSNNTIKYYVDSNGKLNIVARIVYPAGRGYFDKVITLN